MPSRTCSCLLYTSYQVKAGDVIEVAASSRSSELFKRLLGQDAPVFLIHAWMAVSYTHL